jgi:uroporphyrin-3 C-methyltransferase
MSDDKNEAEVTAKAKPDTPQLLDELARKNAASSSRKRKTSSWLPGLLLVYVLLLSTGGGWFFYQQWQQQAGYQQTLQTIQADNRRLREQLSETESDMRDALEDQVSRMQASRDALNDALDELGQFEQSGAQRLNRFEQQFSRDMQDVNSIVNAVQRQLGNLQQRDTRWLNAEANYLVRLAQRKLVMESDVTSALLLLRSAHGLLEDQASILALTARQAIADDIRQLQSVQLPDKLVLATQLSTMSAEIEQLTLIGMRQETYREGVQEGWQQSKDAGWLASGLNLLRTIFVWREWDDSPTQMLPAQQEVLVKRQIQLQLEQARLALIQGDQALYRHVLEQSSGLLNAHFSRDAERVQNVAREIERLSEFDTAVELPDLSASVQLVNQLAMSAGVSAGVPDV